MTCVIDSVQTDTGMPPKLQPSDVSLRVMGLEVGVAGVFPLCGQCYFCAFWFHSLIKRNNSFGEYSII